MRSRNGRSGVDSSTSSVTNHRHRPSSWLSLSRQRPPSWVRGSRGVDRGAPRPRHTTAQGRRRPKGSTVGRQSLGEASGRRLEPAADETSPRTKPVIQTPGCWRGMVSAWVRPNDPERTRGAAAPPSLDRGPSWVRFRRTCLRTSLDAVVANPPRKLSNGSRMFAQGSRPAGSQVAANASLAEPCSSELVMKQRPFPNDTRSRRRTRGVSTTPPHPDERRRRARPNGASARGFVPWECAVALEGGRVVSPPVAASVLERQSGAWCVGWLGAIVQWLSRPTAVSLASALDVGKACW